MPHRSAPRLRSLVAGGAAAALAVVGGGTVVAFSQSPERDAGDIALTQNAVEQAAGAEQAAQPGLEVGQPVDLDLKEPVRQAAGGQLPPDTQLQITGLPDGLTQEGWKITGTPTKAGSYDVQVTITALGQTKSQTMKLEVAEAGQGAQAQGQVSEPATSPAESTSPSESTSPAAAAANEGGAVSSSPSASASATATTSPAAAAAQESGAQDGTQASGTTSAVPTSTDAAVASGAPTETASTTPEAPDLCTALSGGTVDGAALAASVAPMLGEAGEHSIITGVLGALTQILPQILGNFGSLGQIACMIAPPSTSATPVSPTTSQKAAAQEAGQAYSGGNGVLTTTGTSGVPVDKIAAGSLGSK